MTDHRNKALEVLGYLLVAAVSATGGAMIEAHFDEQTATQIAGLLKKDQDRERGKWEERERGLNETIDSERKARANEIQKRDDHLRAFTVNAGRMRNDLEAQLSESRRDGQSCIANAARTAEAVGAVLDSVGEVVAVAHDLDGENRSLKADNARLAEKLRGWQQRYADSHQRIVVTATKK